MDREPDDARCTEGETQSGDLEGGADLTSPWPPELFDDCECFISGLHESDETLVGLWRHAWLQGPSRRESE